MQRERRKDKHGIFIDEMEENHDNAECLLLENRMENSQG